MQIEDVILPEARSAKHFLRGQVQHLAALSLLLLILWTFCSPYLGDGDLLGKADSFWFWLAVGLVVVQQLSGWIVFRGQLGWAFLSRWFGKADMLVWGIVFLPLLVARPLLLLALGLADRGSLALPCTISLPLGLILLVPSSYALASVVRYFGFARALGGDHSRSRYRRMALVKEGAYRWTDNAMYTLVFLALWSIALLTRSQSAFALALFQHAYVWVHYHCTEKPDMELMYPPVDK